MSKKSILLLVLVLILISSLFIYLKFFRINRLEYIANMEYEDFDSYLPSDQTALRILKDDTNGNGFEELHIISKDETDHFFIYIFDKEGLNLYKNEILLEPLGIELKKYKDSTYKSLYLKYGDSFQSGYYISWDGLEYLQKTED